MSKTAYLAVFLMFALVFSVASAEMMAGVQLGANTESGAVEAVADVAITPDVETDSGTSDTPAVSSGNSSGGSSRRASARSSVFIKAPQPVVPALPQVDLLGVASVRYHLNRGLEAISVNMDGGLTSEPRAGGIHMLTMQFDGNVQNAHVDNVVVQEMMCNGPDESFQPYSGDAEIFTKVDTDTDTAKIVFFPALESGRTYKITVSNNGNVNAGGNQSWDVMVRSLQGDVNSDGRVNATDRSLIVRDWTGADGYSMQTDLTMNGETNGADREVVVDAWWQGSNGQDVTEENCAPTPVL